MRFIDFEGIRNGSITFDMEIESLIDGGYLNICSPDNARKVANEFRDGIEAFCKDPGCGDVIKSFADGSARSEKPIVFYADDPSFRDAKVVMNLFDDKLVSPLNEKLAEKLKYDGFTDEELAPILGKEATYEDLMKLAVDNSDGVIQCSPKISSKVMKIVEDSKLPFLKYKKGEYSQFVDRCMEFYHSL